MKGLRKTLLGSLHLLLVLGLLAPLQADAQGRGRGERRGPDPYAEWNKKIRLEK